MSDTSTLRPHLMLLDSMALIYRAHYALITSPRFTSGGVCTSAVFGMANTLLDLTKNTSPSHLVAVIDTPEPTHRHVIYPEYKANREAMPEDLSQQIPLVMRLFEAFRIAVAGLPGYEADDIMGTLAVQGEREGMDVWLVTPDKDLQQLVSDQIQVYRPGRRGGQFELLGRPEVCDRWGVESPSQVLDILSLMGDKSDNVPGVPGIGEKTAQRLIKEFGSVEALLGRSEELKGKQRARIEQHRDLARLSKQLITIDLDVPHTWNWGNFQTESYDEQALRKLFVELEFETLGKRLFGSTFSANAARAATARKQREVAVQQELFGDNGVDEVTLADVPHDYLIADTPQRRAELIETLLSKKAFCFDTEATGLDPRCARPLGLAFAWKAHEAVFVPVPTDVGDASKILEEFRVVFEHDEIEKIGHNLKYDISLLKWNGIDVAGPMFDTMLAHSMLEPEMQHGLDYLASVYLGYKPITLASLIGERGPDQKAIESIPMNQLAEYAAEDADVTWRISEVIRKSIGESGVERVCYDVEFPLIPVLVDMEYQGIRLDTDALAAVSQSLEREITSLRRSILEAAGHDFNIDSPRQLGVVLYEELKLDDKPKKTPTGQYSTRESELLRLAPKHPIVANVLEYRNAAKLKSVYVDQLPHAVDERTKHLHTHYSQAWTATGRMQSNDPNLQTIPVRKERGRDIRAAFVPRSDEYLILSADYSQIELRIMADLSQDTAMLEAFRHDEDIHTVTASQIYKLDPSEVTREMRARAKTVNFGILYGISAFGLQQRLNIPRTEASALINGYFEKYPGVQRWIDTTIAFARENGYVETRTGRKRYLRDINSRNRTRQSAAERLAMNSPIQGTAADMLKLAMVSVHKALRTNRYRTKMLLTVHDEIVFDLHRDEQATVVPLIVELMSNALAMTVPIKVETGVGENWLVAH